jgi:hypothetical protein
VGVGDLGLEEGVCGGDGAAGRGDAGEPALVVVLAMFEIRCFWKVLGTSGGSSGADGVGR